MLPSDTVCLGRQKDRLTLKNSLKMLEIHTQHQLPQKYPLSITSTYVLLCAEDFNLPVSTT